MISWETNDPAGAEVRVSTSPGRRKTGQQKQRNGPDKQKSRGLWIRRYMSFAFTPAASPIRPIDSVRFDATSIPLPSRSARTRGRSARGNVDMAEFAFYCSVIPVYLQTGRFGQVFPVLLHQFAIDALRGRVGETEISQFIGTAIPEYLDSSIAGKIVATPNPVPFGEDVLISWGTNDPAGGEVRLLMASGEEKLITRQPSGQMKIPWITGLTAHEFRLYASSRPNTRIDSVKVRRDIGSTPAVMREIANEVTRGTIDMMELSQFIARVVPRCLHSKEFHEIFQLWERTGFHVTPVHFYQPIPDTQNSAQNAVGQAERACGNRYERIHAA